jgi:hypothetical protein
LRFPDINVSEDMLDFFLFQVSQHMPGVPFERYGKNGLALGNVAGIGGGQILEEGMNGGQPDVAGSSAIFSPAAKVFQELSDQPVGKVINGKIGAGLPATFHCKLEKEFEGIPVRQYRVWTHPPLGDQVLFKETTNGEANAITLCHGSPLCPASGTEWRNDS